MCLAVTAYYEPMNHAGGGKRIDSGACCGALCGVCVHPDALCAIMPYYELIN